MAKNDYGYVAKIGGDTTGLQMSLQDAQNSLKEAESGIKALDKTISDVAKNGGDTSDLLAAREQAYASYANTVKTQMKEISGISGEVQKAFEEGRIEAGEYATYMSQLAQASERFNATQRELSSAPTAYDEYKAAISDVEKSLNGLDRELSAVNTAMKTAGETEELMGQKSAVLEDTINSLSEKLKTLESSEAAVAQAYLDGKIDTDQFNEFERQIEITRGQLEAYRTELEQVNQALNPTAYDEYRSAMDSANNSVRENKERLSEINESIINANTAHLGFNSTLELNKQRQEALKAISSELKDKLQELKNEASDMKEALKLGNVTQQQYDEFRRSVIDTEAELKNLKNQTGEYNEKASAAADKTGVFGEVLKANLTSAAIINAVEALGKAIGDIVNDVEELIHISMEAGDTIDKQSQILGLSREAYQEWDYVLNLNGASISSMTSATRKLTEAVEKEDAAFAQLGLSMNDVKNMSREELFENVIYRLQGLTNEQQRNAIANDLLGRSYTQLIPLLNQSADSTKALQQAAHDNGILMSDEAVNSAVKYKDSLTTLQYTLNGLKNNLLGKIMPGLAEISEGISDIAAGNEDGAEKIKQGVTDTADSIFSIISEVIENVEQVIDIAVEAIPEIISDNSDELLAAGQKIIQDILSGISRHTGDVIKFGGGILALLVQGIGNAVVTLSGEYGVIVSNLIAALIDAIPDVIDFSVIFCQNMADQIVNYDWAEMAYNMVDNIIDGLSSAWKKMQVWIDDTFNGGKVYDGDINNVHGFTEELENDWKDKNKRNYNYTKDFQTEFQENYNNNKSWGNDTSDGIIDDAEKTAEAVQEADDLISEAFGGFTTSLETDSEKADKALTDRTRKTMENLKRIQQEQGLSDEWLMEQYKLLADSLEKGTDAYYAAYDAYLDMRDKVRDENDRQAEEDRKQREKAFEDEKKDAEKRLDELEKQHDEEVKQKKKEAEDNLSLLRETQEGYARSASEMSERVTDDKGKERLVLQDYNKEVQRLKKYRESMEKLKALGLSEELIESVNSFSYEDGSRQMYIDELLKMRPEKRGQYDKEYQAYIAEQKKTAEYDTGLSFEDEEKSLLDASNGVLDEASEKAYEYGKKAGELYIKGMEDIFNSGGIIEAVTMKNPAAVQNNKSNAPAAGNSGNVSGNSTGSTQGISPKTAISINIAGTSVIRTTLEELLRENILTGGTIRYV